MLRDFGYALCAGLACFLAVIYTLCQLDWEVPQADAAPDAAAQAPAEPGK
jgi:hypothetical protein